MKITDVLSEEMRHNVAFMNIMERRSVRQYADLPVSDEQISAILHAAMSAPSGVNRQPWEFVVINRRETLKSLADALPYAKMTADAPVAIVVCANKTRFLDGVDSSLWEQDLSACSENILLAAHALGLGGVWTCVYPHLERIEPVKSILSLPDEFIPFNLIPIGVPASDHAPMNKWHPDRIHLVTGE